MKSANRPNLSAHLGLWRKVLAAIAAFICLLWLGLAVSPIRDAFAAVLQKVEIYRIAAGVTMPVSGSVAVTGIANPLPVSTAAAPASPLCVLGTAPICMTVTDAEDEIVLPASVDTLYLISVNEIEGAANATGIDCIAGAAPEAVYGTTGDRFSAPFKGYLHFAGANWSCDAPAGTTLYVCATACTR